MILLVAALGAVQGADFVSKIGNVQGSAGRLSSPVWPGEALGVWPEGDFPLHGHTPVPASPVRPRTPFLTRPGGAPIRAAVAGGAVGRRRAPEEGLDYFRVIS